MADPTFAGQSLGTLGNTLLRFPIPSHTDGSKAVVSVTINGNQTPVVAPPAGWTIVTAAYNATANTTFVVWTHDNLPAATTFVDVSWPATAVAAGTVTVSVDAQAITIPGTATVVLGVNTATAGGGPADTDDYPVIVGGTNDGNPKLQPTLDATFVDGVWNAEQQTGVDAWVLWPAGPITPTNERQTLTSGRTGGTFTLDNGGTPTGPLQAANETAPNVQTAVEGLPGVGAGNVVCTGGPLPTPIVIEFVGALASTDVALLNLIDSGTGGTPMGITTTQQGGQVDGYTYGLTGTGVEAGGGSHTTSQLVLFQAAPNPGPAVFLNTPNQVGCVTDPVTVAGYSTSEIGVGSVDVEIMRGVDGLYWDGVAWVAGPVSNPASLGTPGGTSTTFTFNAAGAFTQAGSYTITVTATDTDSPPVVGSIAVGVCVAGPTAVARSRSGTRLGDGGTIMVEVVGRPGGVSPGAVVARLPVVAEQSYFERRLDSTSEAKVVAKWSPLDLRRCCDDIARIETFAHEIRIWWDGIVAWVGPITFLRHTGDSLVIDAADRTVHWETRVIGGYRHDNVPLSDIFGDYHRDAYAQDPFDLTVVVQDVNLTGTRLVLESDGMVAERALSELSRTAIDWTCVGSQLLIGGQEVPVRAVPTLTDRHFTSPLDVVEDGTLRATDFVMTGGNDINNTADNTPVSGRATLPESDPRRRRYGLITGRSQDSKIIDQESINAAARTRLEFGQDPVYVDANEAVLTPNAPVQMVDLIPGARVDVVAAATCRQVATKFRFWRVKATLNGRVQVQFQPLGSVTPGTL